MASKTPANDTKKPVSDRPEQRKQRNCLMCAKPFNSAHIGERVCPNCKSTSAWREGGYAA